MDSTTVFWLGLIGAGLGLGWRAARRPWRAARVLPWLALPLLPLALFPLAQLLHSDTLGWIAGLSMLFGLALGGPLLLSLALGWAARRVLRGPARADPPPDAPDDPGRATAPWAAAAAALQAVVRHLAAPARRALLLVIAGTGAAIVLGLALGFRMHDQAVTPPLDAAVGPAAVVLAASLLGGLGWAAAALHRRRRPSAMRRQATASTARARTAHAALADDPRHAPYHARVARGELFWTPDRADYDLDPQATTCCPHLAPLERRLRRQGVPLRLHGPGRAQADLCLALPAGQTLPDGQDALVYEEPVAWDRSVEDPPIAQLRCRHCASSVELVHPGQARPSTHRLSPEAWQQAMLGP